MSGSRLRWSHEVMSNGGSDPKPGDRVFGLLGVFGVVCTVIAVITGLAVLGWFIFAGIAMSRFGSNK